MIPSPIGCPDRSDAGGCEEGLAMRDRLRQLLHSETAYTMGFIGLAMLPVVLAIAVLFSFWSLLGHCRLPCASSAASVLVRRESCKFTSDIPLRVHSLESCREREGMAMVRRLRQILENETVFAVGLISIGLLTVALSLAALFAE
jgi:hypothetical protein